MHYSVVPQDREKVSLFPSACRNCHRTYGVDPACDNCRGIKSFHLPNYCNQCVEEINDMCQRGIHPKNGSCKKRVAKEFGMAVFKINSQ